jgi:hypothetical protein
MAPVPATTADSTAAERRARRQGWASHLYEAHETAQATDDDRRFWLSLDGLQRLELVWDLSVEAFGLAQGKVIDARARLPRADYVLQRR